MNILVTSLSRKVPLLEALRRGLEDVAPGGVVWGADSDPQCVGRHFADRFWQMPPLSEPDAADELLGFCSRERIGLLVPTRDGELEFMAGLRERLAEGGTLVAVGTHDAVSVCLDKLSFYMHCERESIPTVRTAARLDELEGECLVVKDRRGAGAREAAVGVDREGARTHAERLPEPVFQPLAAGVEHSIDLYVSRADRVVEAAPRTRIRVHDGESTVTETVEHPALAAAAVRLAESLDLRGHLVVQGFASEDGEVTLLECNPRVGGASTLGFAAGVDTPRWAIREALGETVEPRLGSYRRGLRMVRYPADRLIGR